MPELFGAVAGQRQARIDKDAHQLNQLMMQKEQVGVMESLITMQQQAKMLQAMGGGGEAPPTPDQIADNMDRMSAAAAGAGLLDKADKFATTGTQIRKNQVDIEAKQQEQLVGSLSLLGTILNNPKFPIQDEESWAKANDFYQLQTGKKSPFADMPYSPELVGRLQVGVLNAKDQALVEARKAQTKVALASEAEHKKRLSLIEAQTRLADERRAALNKAGSVVKPPKAEDLRAITDLLVADFGMSMLPEDARNMSRPVAEKMLEIMAMGGFSKSEAALLAYKEAKDRGDFAGVRVQLSSPGSIRRPLEMPTKDGILDKSKLKPNLIYKGTGPYTGQLLVFTGTGFNIVKPQEASGANTAIDDDEIVPDDEEEEE